MTQEIPFEKAIEKLEKIVADLESGEVSLEEALKKYEEGVKLSQVCQDRLSQAEKKIEILSRGLDGSLIRKDFDGEEDLPAEETGRKSAVRKTRSVRSDEEEGLL